MSSGIGEDRAGLTGTCTKGQLVSARPGQIKAEQLRQIEAAAGCEAFADTDFACRPRHPWCEGLWVDSS